MSALDQHLIAIIASLKQTRQSVDSTKNTFVDEADLLIPTMVKQVLQKSNTELEGMSLLALKSNALLSYLEDLALIIMAHLERLQNGSAVEQVKTKAVESAIRQRVTLEKGIKPLEKKLSYQLDKMVRAFHRMEEENSRLEQKMQEKQALAEEHGVSASDPGSQSESDSEDSDDALSYKPDASALAKMVPKNKRAGSKGKQADDTSKEDKYQPPKISAVAPPSNFDDRGTGKKSNRKLQSMEEYLAENSELPQAENSIGSTIMGNGRGGDRTGKDKQKDKEVQLYEENNFTRLPTTATKKTHRQRMAERVNHFAGEDWSMFSNKRNLKEGTSRKRTSGSTWDRVKRQRS